jgi:uncharacterized protein (TIGR03437 family)
VRNAPGLFARPEEPYALAAHSSGTAITKESPAEPGETITVYGTGLGPYDGHTIDGFPVPEWLALKLVDAVEVLIGGQAIEPAFAGAAAGQIGVVAVRFQVPEGLPAAAELRVRVNGRESNGVLLPVVEKPATE